MKKHSEFVTLELDSDKLEKITSDLREKILSEFWSHVPEGERRDEIRTRIESSIISALGLVSADIEAT